MLRITVHNNSQAVTFQLEGRLTDPLAGRAGQVLAAHAVE